MLHGMETLKPSTLDALKKLTLCAAGTLASLSLSPEDESEKLTTEIFGRPCSESFAFFDPPTSSWKTYQGTFLWDSDKYSETWPPAGTMRNGKCYLQPEWEPLTFAGGSSLWPTPTVFGNSNSPKAGTKRGTGLSTAAKMWPTPRASDGEKGSRNQKFFRGNLGLEAAVHHFPTPLARDAKVGNKKRVGRFGTKHGGRNLNDEMGGKLNPTWVEWLMGFPVGWTELSASEMRSFLTSRRKSVGG